MALKLNAESRFGFVVQNSICRIHSVQIVSRNEIEYVAHFYAEIGKPSFREMTGTCAYVIGGENPIKQAYEHLKTLPEFEGAVDC